MFLVFFPVVEYCAGIPCIILLFMCLEVPLHLLGLELGGYGRWGCCCFGELIPVWYEYVV